MFLLRQVLPAAVMAMMVAAGICGLALAFKNARAQGSLGPLAIGIGYITGHLFIAGWSTFPPADTTNWLPYFAAMAAVLGAFWSVLRVKTWPSLVIFALVSPVALRLLLRPKFQYGWSFAQGWAWVGCLGAALVILVLVLDFLLRQSAVPFEGPLFLLIICGGTFGALLLSGSVLLGQFALILGAAVFGSLILTGRKANPGIVPVFSLMEGALLVSGCFFAALPFVSAALLAFAPLPALIPIKVPGRFSSLGIRAALVLLPVAGALVVAYLSSPPLDY